MTFKAFDVIPIDMSLKGCISQDFPIFNHIKEVREFCSKYNKSKDCKRITVAALFECRPTQVVTKRTKYSLHINRLLIAAYLRWGCCKSFSRLLWHPWKEDRASGID
jgi:hypothetical protein